MTGREIFPCHSGAPIERSSSGQCVKSKLGSILMVDVILDAPVEQQIITSDWYPGRYYILQVVMIK